MLRAGTLLLLTPALVLADPPESIKPVERRRVVGAAVARADEATIARASNRFALDLYGQLRDHDGNLFFSPVSLWSALALTSAGARGETLAGLSAGLHAPPQDALHLALEKYLAQLNASRQLGLACGLWGRRGLSYHDDFLTLARRHYPGGFHTIDFANPDKARGDINAWVAKHTNDRVPQLLRPGVLSRDASLVLTSAVGFKAPWATPFDKDRTAPADFHLAAGNLVRVPLMHLHGRLAFAETPTHQAVEIPYAGGDLSMVVLLPTDGLPAFEKALTLDKLTRTLAALKPTKVGLALPRFSLGVESQLRKPLTKLGFDRAFTSADFTGFCPDADLALSAVVHKATVEVTEQGTTAAAATGVLVVAKSGEADPVLRADRPFVFLIRERRTGGILFLGRLAQPRGDAGER